MNSSEEAESKSIARITPRGIYAASVIGQSSVAPHRIEMLTFSVGERSWCLHIGIFGSKTALVLDNFIRAHGRETRFLAAKEDSERFLAEALNYVQNRPEGMRSDYLVSNDPELAEYRDEAISDVRTALVHALVEEDAFQAAVAFERATPYLKADIELPRMMQTILAAFDRTLVGGDFAARSAAAMEEKLRETNSFANMQIGKWKKDSWPPTCG